MHNELVEKTSSLLFQISQNITRLVKTNDLVFSESINLAIAVSNACTTTASDDKLVNTCGNSLSKSPRQRLEDVIYQARP